LPPRLADAAIGARPGCAQVHGFVGRQVLPRHAAPRQRAHPQPRRDRPLPGARAARLLRLPAPQGDAGDVLAPLSPRDLAGNAPELGPFRGGKPLRVREHVPLLVRAGPTPFRRRPEPGTLSRRKPGPVTAPAHGTSSTCVPSAADGTLEVRLAERSRRETKHEEETWAAFLPPRCCR